MSQWKNIGAVVALSITAALAGTGCLAHDADDDATENEITAADQESGTVADEKTGEADQAFFGQFGSLGFGLNSFGLCWPNSFCFSSVSPAFAGQLCGFGACGVPIPLGCGF